MHRANSLLCQKDEACFDEMVKEIYESHANLLVNKLGFDGHIVLRCNTAAAMAKLVVNAAPQCAMAYVSTWSCGD